jgi:antitoxin component YwqK of YwqJK toxin-antitoxin module
MDLGLVMTKFLKALSSNKHAGARPKKDIPGIDEDGNPKNGPFKLFFRNGLISCQGEFHNGKKSGKWKYFLNNGQMQSSGSFKDGKIVGRWKWFFKTGEPRGTGGFDDEEQKHGVWKRYHAKWSAMGRRPVRTRQEEGHLEGLR